MDKHAIWKWLILVVLVAGSFVVAYPPKEKIRLGLDLAGGASFEVQIDEDRVREELRSGNKALTDEEVNAQVKRTLEGAQGRALEVIRNRVDNLGISEPVIFPGKNNRIVVQLPQVNEATMDKARQSIQSVAFLEFRMVHENNDRLIGDLFDKGLKPEGYFIATVGNRPGYKPDPAAPKLTPQEDEARKARTRRFQAPAGYELMLEKDIVNGETVQRPLFVKIRRELSGESLKDAKVDYRSMGQPVVALEFDSKGAKKFSDVTSDYAPGGLKNPGVNSFRQLAIVLDGTVYSAPVIREAIHGGKAEISGNFTLPEATLLSNILRAGALPAPVKIVDERFVAPSLGADSIRSGITASVVSAVGVGVFMLAFYLWAGVIANIALTLNMILMPIGMIVTAGFLGVFTRESGGGPIQLPVLTLPGIAGLALTLGMAVDANVLIYERIREEQATGKRLWSAVTAGYDRAFLAIFDSNLTTILTGVILFVLGSGPIRGFAVTLNAGILISMFTAIVVTRMLFAVLIQTGILKDIKMVKLIPVTNIDFLKVKKTAAAISIAVIVVSWAVLLARGLKAPERVLGVDFTGGASVTMTFQADQRVGVGDVRQALEAAGVKEANIQYQRDVQGGADKYLQITTGVAAVGGKKPTDAVAACLAEKFPGSQFTVVQTEDIGPQVGAELMRRAVWAIVLSLLGIIIYLAWRFEMGFAMGAIVALVHDVLVTAGVFALMGRQISLPVVAALLTIVGYSVNDTIVVFDRMRENLKLARNRTFPDLCNFSVNQTLSRTILTNLLTMFSVTALMVLGGGAINDFALTLFIGMIAGTYSTVYIATPVVLAWHKNKMPEMATKKA